MHRPGNSAVAGTFAGGPWPSPTNHGTRSTKPDKRSHPGGRRAGCPHPAGPRGGANARGRDKSRPYDQRKVRSHRETALSTVSQTSVGDDACTAPAGAFRRPKTAGPALRPEIVPGALRRRKVPRADMESAPAGRGTPRGQPQTQPRRAPRVGAHIVRPGNPAAAQTPRAG